VKTSTGSSATEQKFQIFSKNGCLHKELVKRVHLNFRERHNNVTMAENPDKTGHLGREHMGDIQNCS
jgi:hypothetical protein